MSALFLRSFNSAERTTRTSSVALAGLAQRSGLFYPLGLRRPERSLVLSLRGLCLVPPILWHACCLLAGERQQEGRTSAVRRCLVLRPVLVGRVHVLLSCCCCCFCFCGCVVTWPAPTVRAWERVTAAAGSVATFLWRKPSQRSVLWSMLFVEAHLSPLSSSRCSL